MISLLQYTISKKISLAILSTVLVSFFLWWQGNIGLDLADEGYLWYGTQRILYGEVPIRDYWAYDPGRYYWSAMFFYLLGENGIIELRIAMATFQALGLSAALYLVGKLEVGNRSIYIFISSLILLVWMFPRHKYFDISLSIFLIAALVRLLESPKRINFFLTGLCIGWIAVFGRNHGVYGILASVGVIVWLQINRPLNRNILEYFLLWGLGICVGFAPIIFMCIWIPGFGKAFIDSVVWIIESKFIAIPLPVPWPWKVAFSSENFGIALRGFFIGVFFVLLLGLGVIGMIWASYRKIKNQSVSPVFVASVFLILPYAHHAFSRADVSHLSQSIFPLLVALLSILSLIRNPFVRWGGVLTLLTVSLYTMSIYHPGWHYRNNRQGYENLDFPKYSIKVNPGTASMTSLVKKMYNKHTTLNEEGGATFIVLPYFPGIYAMYQQKSPVDILFLFNRGDTWQKREIKKIQETRPDFIFLSNHPYDGLEERRFSNVNPVLYRYLKEHFSMAEGYPLQNGFEVFERSK